MKKLWWISLLIAALFNGISDGWIWWSGGQADFWTWTFAIMFSVMVARDALKNLFP